MSRRLKRTCSAHRTHLPSIRIGNSFTVEEHHIWPLGHDGPDVAANRVWLCPTGHSRVHELLTAWLAAGGRPSWKVLVWYGQAERELARRGYVAITTETVS